MIGPIQDILAAACELANARAAKVLVSRTPQHADLALEQFVAIFEQSWTFIAATEAVSGRVIVSLRGVITSQARAFLLKYHAKRLQASAKFVEEEQWNQVEISAALQKQTQLIVSSAIADPPGFLINSPNGDVHAVNGHAERANGTAELAKSLDIEGQTFFIVQATAKTLEMLEDYLRLVINLESVATDVMARVVEFLKVRAYTHQAERRPILTPVHCCSHPVFQLENLSSSPRRRCHALCGIEEHHRKASRSGISISFRRHLPFTLYSGIRPTASKHQASRYAGRIRQAQA